MAQTNGGRNEHRTPIVVVMCSDDTYVRPTAVTITSVLHNLAPGYTVELYLVDRGISQAHRNRVEHVLAAYADRVTLHWRFVDTSGLDAIAPSESWLNSNAYVPLWMETIVPASVNKALYLDSDLVVEGSLSDLWNRELHSAALLAAQDQWIPHISSHAGIHNHTVIDASDTHPYFNSGVMVCNLEKWRAAHVNERARAYIRRHTHAINLADQGVLNAVLMHDWKALPPSWNVHHKIGTKRWIREAAQWPLSDFRTEMRARYSTLLSYPHILHFAGPEKPWKTDHHPEALRWFRYAWRSRWMTLRERARSIPTVYQRQSVGTIKNATRPIRHWVARRVPAPLTRVLAPYTDE